MLLRVLFVCDNVGEWSSHYLLHVAVKAKSSVRYMFYISDVGHTVGIEGQMSVDQELFQSYCQVNEYNFVYHLAFVSFEMYETNYRSPMRAEK
jgi:hypothetical protein